MRLPVGSTCDLAADKRVRKMKKERGYVIYREGEYVRTSTQLVT